MKRRHLAVAAVAVAGAAAVAAWAAGAGSTGRASFEPPSDCVEATLPPLGGEVDTLLDKEHGVLTVSAYDPALQADRRVTIRFRDPACLARPDLRRVIEDAVRTDAQAQAQVCASLRAALARGAAEIRGRRIDRDAGQRYVGEWC